MALTNPHLTIQYKRSSSNEEHIYYEFSDENEDAQLHQLTFANIIIDKQPLVDPQIMVQYKSYASTERYLYLKLNPGRNDLSIFQPLFDAATHITIIGDIRSMITKKFFPWRDKITIDVTNKTITINNSPIDLNSLQVGDTLILESPLDRDIKDKKYLFQLPITNIKKHSNYQYILTVETNNPHFLKIGTNFCFSVSPNSTIISENKMTNIIADYVTIKGCAGKFSNALPDEGWDIKMWSPTFPQIKN